MTKRKVLVVVLGDFTRSPRMRYHTESLRKRGHKPFVVAYNFDSSVENTSGSSLTPYPLSLGPPDLILKPLWQTVTLTFAFFYALISFGIPSHLLVQNPPGVPTLPICWFMCRVLGTKLIVDMHNYGFTLLGMSPTDGSTFLRFLRDVYAMMEFWVARRADLILTVSKEMLIDLQNSKKCKNPILVLYDKPHERFGSNSSDGPSVLEQFGRSENEEVLVSSTSWTLDEDFGILLRALQDYDCATNVPPLLVFITGKGPLKEFYQKKIKEITWEKVRFELPWLSHDDYPRLLSAASVGVCLHTSTSGLDLPMKVVDMFGSGLPVFAFNYLTISELVDEGKNGHLFSTSRQLGQLIIDWFRKKDPVYETSSYRTHLRDNFMKLRWHSNWVNVLGEYF